MRHVQHRLELNWSWRLNEQSGAEFFERCFNILPSMVMQMIIQPGLDKRFMTPGLSRCQLHLDLVRWPCSSSGRMGSRCCFGSSQRFGVPTRLRRTVTQHSSCRQPKKRRTLPYPDASSGNLCGQYTRGNRCLAWLCNTRDRHAAATKQSSNICAAPAVSAVMVLPYAVCDGPNGVRRNRTTAFTRNALRLAAFAETAWVTRLFTELSSGYGSLLMQAKILRRCKAAAKVRVNFRIWADYFSISLDETTGDDEIRSLGSDTCWIAKGTTSTHLSSGVNENIRPDRWRELPLRFLAHPVFNARHSESEMLRYITTSRTKGPFVLNAFNDSAPGGLQQWSSNATSPKWFL